MKDLHRKALIGILRTFFMLIAVDFLPAWTLRYWQGWACLAAFFIPACAITVWVARHDPALLERRLKAGAKAEKEKGQKSRSDDRRRSCFWRILRFPRWIIDSGGRAFRHRPRSPVILMMVTGFVIVLRGLQGKYLYIGHHRGRRRPEGHLHRTLCSGPPSHVLGCIDYAVWDSAGARFVVGNAGERADDGGDRVATAGRGKIPGGEAARLRRVS